MQHVESGMDITSTGAKFTLDVGGDTVLDVYVDGGSAADYEIRAGPDENNIFSAAVLSLTGSTNYANTGNRIAAGAIEVRVTTSATSGTADVYVASR